MKKSIKKLSAVFLVMVILLISVIPAFAADNEINGKNWMSNLDGSKKITEINIPGTHDSCTQNIILSPVLKTQSHSVYEQLNMGVRYFDMRFKYEDNEFTAVHSFGKCRTSCNPFSDKLTAGLVIEDCKKFLAKNPGETILFQLKIGDGEQPESFYSAFYDKYINADKDLWFIENRVPTLEEARGKIVLLRVVPVDENRFDDSNSGINFSTYPHVEEPEVINFKSSKITKLSDKKAYAGLYVQDSYKLKPEEKWTAVKTFIEQDLNPNNFNINLSSYAGSKLPEGNAKDMNPRILNYNLENGRYFGILATDFVTAELAQHIYKTNDFAADAIFEIPEVVHSNNDCTVILTIGIVLCIGIIIAFIIVYKIIIKRKHSA